jgi:hypothetical protein
VAAQAVPGSYELSFHVLRNGILEPVSSLAVSSEELILMAQVEDSARVPAQAGAATFEYCSFKGLPPNDITRPDEAPKEACDAGLARWARLTTVKLDAGTCPGFGAGSACMNFGIVQIPRTVGFRFRYTGQGSGIASGVSAEINFTWTPATWSRLLVHINRWNNRLHRWGHVFAPQCPVVVVARIVHVRINRGLTSLEQRASAVKNSWELRAKLRAISAQTSPKTKEYQRPESETNQQLRKSTEICKTSIPGSNPGGASILNHWKFDT